MANYSYLLRIFFCFSVLFGFQLATGPAMSYEEPKYTVVSETDTYEVRRYESRTVAEVTYETDNSGFRILFDYISGANLGSGKLEMTVPVTQSENYYDCSSHTIKYQWQNDMRFFLPEEYSTQNAQTTDQGFVLLIYPTVFWGYWILRLRV